jgi:surface antigen
MSLFEERGERSDERWCSTPDERERGERFERSVGQTLVVEQCPDAAPATPPALEERASSQAAVSPQTQPLALPAPPAAPATGELETGPAAEAEEAALIEEPATPVPTRRPVLVIHAPGRRQRAGLSDRPPSGPPGRRRRWPVQLATLGMVVLMILITSMTVLPEGLGGALPGFNPLRSVMHLIQSEHDNTYQLAQQAATVTAVTQDGYDKGPLHYAGLPPQSGSGDLNRFAYGQCTYWANMRYHQLTGYWVPWLGDAYQWVAGAEQYGWIVSARPHVPSIIVLQPGVQGASSYGHVAVVERMNPDGSVYTSNYNWYANGGWNTLSYVTFYPGRGVSFVWHP